jgi:hypothetical protein
MKQNLNKFTKVELISKLENITKEKLENSKSVNWYRAFTSYLGEILNLFNLIKEVLFKLTFITFIYKILRKYTIIRKFGLYIYRIFIGVFGFTFVNHFGFIDISSEFWNHIIFIYSMIIDYFKDIYNKLNEYFYGKSEETPEPKDPLMIRNSWIESTKPELTEVESNSYIKYYIIAGVLIIGGCFIYCYWNDIIGNTNSWYDTIRDYIRGVDPRPDNDGDSSRINLERSRIYPPKDIPEIKVSSPPLTSPSFDDLTSKANESWGSDSSSSTETLKPVASSSNTTIENLNDNKLFKDKLVDIKFWVQNWRKIISKDVLEKINSVEDGIKSPSTKLSGISIVTSYADIISEYNKHVEDLDFISLSADQFESGTELLYQLRRWIRDNQLNVLPDSKNLINLGNPKDIPSKIKLEDIIQ